LAANGFAPNPKGGHQGFLRKWEHVKGQAGQEAAASPALRLAA
jgi:hypothetical protein